jgi:hypothetical protein
MADALTLGGKAVQRELVLGRSEDVAWLEEKEVFGFTWLELALPSPTPRAVFSVYDAKGNEKLAPTNIVANSSQSRMRIAAGNGGFGIAWIDSKEAEFVFTSASGTFDPVKRSSTQAKMIAERPGVAWSDAGSWAVTSDGLGLSFARFATFDSAVTLVADPTGPSRILGLSTGYLFVGQDLQPALLDKKLAMSAPLAEPVDSGRVIVASNGARFCTASINLELAQPQVSSFDAHGKRVCGPATVGRDGYTVVDAVATNSGYTLALVANESPFDILLQEVSSACEVSAPVSLGVAAAGPAFTDGHPSVRLAFGSKGYAMMRSALTLYFFGSNFCD